MAISDNQKLDILWKKVNYGKAATDVGGKAGYEEGIPSPVPTYSKDVWQQAELVPNPPAAVTSVVEEVTSMQCTMDITVGNRTWLTTTSFGDPLTRTGDWIDTTFDPLYLIKVYDGDPSGSGTLLNLATPNEEWNFDYISGALHFPNSFPSGVTEIWVSGYRYVGTKGVGATTNPARIEDADNDTYVDVSTGNNVEVKSTGGSIILDGTVVGAASQDLIINSYVGQNIVLDGLSWPNADGNASQYLQTDGSGVLSWADGDGMGDVVGPASSADLNFAIFDGTTGKLLADSGLNPTDFATAAQGLVADSALQSGDNVSELLNDANYIDSSGAPVQTVNTQTGDVVLDADDIDDTSTTHKFATQAELDKIGHISVTGAIDLDNVIVNPTDAAGYLLNDGSGGLSWNPMDEELVEFTPSGATAVIGDLTSGAINVIQTDVTLDSTEVNAGSAVYVNESGTAWNLLDENIPVWNPVTVSATTGTVPVIAEYTPNVTLTGGSTIEVNGFETGDGAANVIITDDLLIDSTERGITFRTDQLNFEDQSTVYLFFTPNVPVGTDMQTAVSAMADSDWFFIALERKDNNWSTFDCVVKYGTGGTPLNSASIAYYTVNTSEFYVGVTLDSTGTASLYFDSTATSSPPVITDLSTALSGTNFSAIKQVTMTYIAYPTGGTLPNTIEITDPSTLNGFSYSDAIHSNHSPTDTIDVSSYPFSRFGKFYEIGTLANPVISSTAGILKQGDVVMFDQSGELKGTVANPLVKDFTGTGTITIDQLSQNSINRLTNSVTIGSTVYPVDALLVANSNGTDVHDLTGGTYGNFAYLGQDQTFTGANTFTQGITVDAGSTMAPITLTGTPTLDAQASDRGYADNISRDTWTPVDTGDPNTLVYPTLRDNYAFEVTGLTAPVESLKGELNNGDIAVFGRTGVLSGIISDKNTSTGGTPQRLVFITDVRSNGSGVVTVTGQNSGEVTTVEGNETEITVEVAAITGNVGLIPTVNVMAQGVVTPVPASLSLSNGFWVGTADLSGVSAGDIVATHEDGQTSTCTYAIGASPNLSDIELGFNGNYGTGNIYVPAIGAGASALPSGIDVDIRVTSDIPLAHIKVINGTASNDNAVAYTSGVGIDVSGQNNPVTGGFEYFITSQTTSITSGTNTPRSVTLVGVTSEGYESAEKNSAETVTTDEVTTILCDDVYPSANFGISYNNGFSALKDPIHGDTETADVTINYANFDSVNDTILFTTPRNEITIPDPSTYATTKVVSFAAGTYNIDNVNFQVSLTRQRNGRQSDSTAIVRIANTVPTITSITTPSRLRSSPTGNISTVTVNYDQRLIDTGFSMDAGQGTWVGSWDYTLNGNGSRLARNLSILDSMPKGTFAFSNTTGATNLAGLDIGNTVPVAEQDYVLGGFLPRTLTFSAETLSQYDRYVVAIGTDVADTDKLTAIDEDGVTGNISFLDTGAAVLDDFINSNVTFPSYFTIVDSATDPIAYSASGGFLFILDKDVVTNLTTTYRITIEESI